MLLVPPVDAEPWPTLGPQVCALIEARFTFGPGSLKGQPAVLDPLKRMEVYRAYEVYPQGHRYAGRRRFKRVGVSLRKGTAKTELAAWVAGAELHPEGPVRCDGFDANGNPVGRPVRDPYIPMLAFTEEQVTELTFGALLVAIQEGPDADLFDLQADRVIRIGRNGKADGVAQALAGSPNARDGARTTFQTFDEPHRMYLPRQIETHETMSANLPKRAMEDPWSLYVSTAGELGQDSVQERLHNEALGIARGETEDDDPDLSYLHIEADDSHDMSTVDGRIAAIEEASGPIPEYGPHQFRDIARQWDRPEADRRYLERVWTNRWLSSAAHAFDLSRVKELRTDAAIAPGAVVSAGFDGARFRDSTALVITDYATGRQQVVGAWQRPLSAHDGDGWEVDADDVNRTVDQMHATWNVAKAYGDPPYWVAELGVWAGKYPVWEEWWTNKHARMAWTVRAYREAQQTGAVGFVQRDPESAVGRLDEVLIDHLGNAGRRLLNLFDDQGQQLFVMTKLHRDRKFDAAMAGCLSWRAHLDLVKEGGPKPSKPAPVQFAPIRVR